MVSLMQYFLHNLAFLENRNFYYQWQPRPQPCNMAASGKKSKKAKWIKANMGVIIAEPTAISTTNNWADSVDEETESYGYAARRPPVVLPSASRAARGGMAVDEESIPRHPPYIAHISNLPYDVEESAIADLFAGLKITNLRLPREGGRLKGFGYVDFEDRESLVNAMNIEDLTVGGRRIRIEVSNNDNDRRMGRSGRSDRDREYDPERTMGDWRSGPRAVPESQARARTMDRDRERDRERESSTDNKPGGWRDGERQAPAEPARTPYGGRDSYGRDRYGDDRGRERGGFGRDGFRSERDGFGSRDGRGFGGRGFGDRDPLPREESKPRERPKLNLLPRTVPREPEVPVKPADGAPVDDKPEKPKPVPAEKVFGAAKPVDTAAKEREIEERLRKQEEEARRAAEEKERWGRKNDHSSDRRGGGRRDDRGRDSRSYNRDRRDYSKDDRDRRDYSKDNRERRDHSRERRDYSKEDRDRRDRDDRDRRDRDDRDRRDRDDRDRRDRDDRDRRDRDDRDRRDRDDRDHRDYRDDRDGRDSRDHRDEKDTRDYRDDRDRRDYSRERDRRDCSGDRDDRSRNDKARESSPEARKASRSDEDREQNGRERPSRSRERHEDREDKPLPKLKEQEKPLPKLKEQEKPIFVASNKFSFLEDADDGGSD